MTAMTTKGIAWMIEPMTSEMISSGTNAAIVVSDEENTGAAMRRAPVSAASAGDMPPRARVAACSPTTMASSTTMPSAMIRPNRLIMLIDWPLTSMTPSVASNETGMPTTTQKATRPLRKMNRMAMTRISPPRPLRSSRSMRLRIRSAATSYWAISRLGGSVARSSTR